jgi:peptidoglycan LD-endopeptidase CwlK
MADVISTLDTKFQPLVRHLIEVCRASGVEIKPYYGIRTPLQQARLWRQSRSRAEINSVIQNFKNNHCDYLADVMELAGPQNGRWATNALPGYGWHNYGLAVDFFAIRDGEFVQRGDDPMYLTLSIEANKLGLTTGYSWKNQDSGHVQMYPDEPHQRYNMRQINDEMLKRFGAV